MAVFVEGGSVTPFMILHAFSYMHTRRCGTPTARLITVELSACHASLFSFFFFSIQHFAPNDLQATA